ncbi:hypothetical protein E2C01_017879 [Portunus trituberculatus]|uniref:Uncharacterized protein n=1 Tax=Portunus trituberculatus TaxID=210409 RepID=A0A5B7DU11_PORTR|nr:hypothetical protein [Portunus trituberculatus]
MKPSVECLHSEASRSYTHRGHKDYHFTSSSYPVYHALDPDVVILDKVDGHTLAAKPSRTANAVNVQLTVIGEVIVDDQRDLKTTLNFFPHLFCFAPVQPNQATLDPFLPLSLLTCCTSIPRAQMSVVMSTRDCPDLNSFMIASRSFCGMSPCMEETVKFASRIFSVSQSTCVWGRDEGGGGGGGQVRR